jgi:hypothetical protein
MAGTNWTDTVKTSQPKSEIPQVGFMKTVDEEGSPSLYMFALNAAGADRMNTLYETHKPATRDFSGLNDEEVFKFNKVLDEQGVFNPKKEDPTFKRRDDVPENPLRDAVAYVVKISPDFMLKAMDPNEIVMFSPPAPPHKSVDIPRF